MYSRYIPPPKGAPAKAQSHSIAEIAPKPSTKPQPTAYARYIPPSKSNNAPPTQSQSSQHVRFDDAKDGNDFYDGPPAKKAKITEDDSPEKSKKKSKKSKKSKTEGKQRSTTPDTKINGVSGPIGESAEAGADQQSPNGDATALEETSNQQVDVENSKEGTSSLVGKKEEKKIKEKKERKKEKKKKRNVEAATEPEDDTPMRHKSVLERKAKSIRAPKPQVVAEEEEADNAAMQDAPPLTGDAMDVDAKSEEIEVHGLEPLPQPEPVAPDTSKPTYETLPSWLAEPIRVSAQSTAPFTEFGLSPELGIAPETAQRLSAKGYKQAFAIQTGVIPLLLPHHCKSMQGDVLVSAATGSGKTLGYALPMIRDLSNGNRHLTRLRGLVVLPTRELVKQVQQVFDECVGVFAHDGAKRRPRIAIAMGSQSLEQEQNALVDREERYDPDAYTQRAKRLDVLNGSASDGEEDEGYNTEDEERAAIRRREDKIQTLPDHVISYRSKVDVLICTPGRLVEHIKYTPGFSLDFVRWLVVDEADKLLGQGFQQWLDVVIPRLQTTNLPGARNHKQSNLSGVRKVVLSATMTRDLDQLEGLKLRRPRLVVLEGYEVEAADTQADHALPAFLGEAAIKVSDPNLKPLFLLDFLRSKYILGEATLDKAKQEDSDETSSSGSDSDPDSGADSSPGSTKASPAPLRKLPTVLIFTKSNETALRLSRLLTLLAPTFERMTGTLTSTTPYATRRDTMRSFIAGKLRILVASDLVARGIDLPSLDHVINYDMPSSIASYVHRVGRTARAGKTGQAWTLFTNPEARWFWNEVASQDVIQRSRRVERIRVTEEKEDAFNDKVAAYEAALEKLGQEAGAGHGRNRERRQ
ncbi:Uu.00g074710.m01.CDS01 [Anthostomella pinea]|uniref:ATP-dependent RNA helicase n=1 Tax=Anthostomella pinea TaxID=933095 RepID=A0AAI8VPW3_9PEZI|nr:Uu.00g074710.m01.CDS01 [Anthostomella pinea]